MVERRNGRRVLIRRLVDVSWEKGRTAAWGRDIGIGGMYIQSQNGPGPGAHVQLTVRFRRAPTVSIPARVCWTNDDGFAVRFLALDESQRDTIRRVIEGRPS